MAIKKITDLPTIPTTQPSPTLPTTPSANPVNSVSKIIEDQSMDVAISPIVSDELDVLQVLKNSQVDLGNSLAVKHIAGTKTITDYFNQVTPNSSKDGVSVATIDPTSTTRFNKIENMIVITDSELSMAFNVSDNGSVDNNITSTGIIFPGTLRPYVNDLFVAYGEKDDQVIYRVTSVEPIYNTSETGFKIEFMKYYDNLDINLVATRMVDNVYVFSFENVGTDKSAVIEKNIYLVYRRLEKLFNKVNEEYLNRFYDRPKNIIRFINRPTSPEDLKDYQILGEPTTNPNSDFSDESEDMYIFDAYAMAFIAKSLKDTGLSYKGYSICPVSPVYIDEDFERVYKFTVFNAIAKRDTRYLKYKYWYPVKYTQKTIRDMPYKGWFFFEPVSSFNDRCIDLYPPNFVSKLLTNSVYTKEFDTAQAVMFNPLLKFITNKEYIPTNDDVESLLREIDFLDDATLYGTGPLILYMCDSLKRLISQKTL